MKFSLIVILLLVHISLLSQPTDILLLYNKRGRPSTTGINNYVENENNQIRLIKEYEKIINDTLYEVPMYTENLDRWNEELGDFYIPNEIVITNSEKFIGYEYQYLSKFKKLNMSYDDRTIKGVVFHELTHAYFYKKITSRQIKVYPSYNYFHFISNPETRFGVNFIEEGVCEYVNYLSKETPEIGPDIFYPESKEDLLNDENYVSIVYYHSVLFIRDFLNMYNISKGIEILISNPPPSYDEILHPHKFFSRLKIDE